MINLLGGKGSASSSISTVSGSAGSSAGTGQVDYSRLANVPALLLKNTNESTTGQITTAGNIVDVADGVDATMEFKQGGATQYTMGIDNSDSDTFKLHAGTAFDGAGSLEIGSNGTVAIATVNIDGGHIDNTSIGTTTAGPATFTTVSASTSIDCSSGSLIVRNTADSASVTINSIQDSNDTFTNNDTSLMTAKAINNRITSQTAQAAITSGTITGTSIGSTTVSDQRSGHFTYLEASSAIALDVQNNTDATVAFKQGGTAKYVMGIDHSDSDTFKIQPGSTLSGTAGLQVNSSSVVIAGVDINSGAIDSTTVGASTASTGRFTTLEASTLVVDNVTINSIQDSNDTFTNNDTSLMTAKAINNRITSAGSTRNHVYSQRSDFFQIANIAAVSDFGETDANRWTVVSGGVHGVFSVTITPTDATHQILVTGSVAHRFHANDGGDATRGLFALKRSIGTTDTYLPPKADINQRGPAAIAGTDASAMTDPTAVIWKTEFQYFDTPSTTDPVTYTLLVGHEEASGTGDFYFNVSRSGVVGNNQAVNGGSFERGVSNLSAEQLGSFTETAMGNSGSVLGAGARGLGVTLTPLTSESGRVGGAIGESFLNTMGGYGTSPTQAYFSRLSNETKGFIAQFTYPVEVTKFLYWRTPADSSTFCQAPKTLKISGSTGGTSYTVLYSNVGGTGLTFNDYPDTSGVANEKASNHRDKARVFVLPAFGMYTHYKVEVFSVIAPFSGNAAGEFRLGISQASFEVAQVNQVSS